MKKSFLLIAVCGLLLAPLTACNDKDAKSSSSGSKTLIELLNLTDYAAQISIEEHVPNWKTRDFFTTGAGLATLDRCVDGDTAHFYVGDTLVKARFNGIDTPESTGAIEPYGKKASRFTCGILTDAKEHNKPIVLSSENDAIANDSAGRFLTWIWVNGKLLNLEIVQNGFSIAKGSAGTDFEDEFYNANEQARINKLNIWSDELDDEFNYGDFIPMDLKEINEKYLEDKSTVLGQKVEFNAVVTRSCASNAYVQQDFPGDNLGETLTYGLYIFGNYNSNTSKIFKIGNEVHFKGVLAEYGGNLQLTDFKYNPILPPKGSSEIIEENQDFSLLTMTIPELKARKLTNILVKLENVTYVAENSYSSNDGLNKSFAICVEDEDGNQIIVYANSDVTKIIGEDTIITDLSFFEDKGPMTIVGNLNYYDPEDGLHEAGNQINISDFNDITFLS